MRYLCTNCAYIYDESIWDIEDWYDPWVKLYDMQDYFLCPACWERVWYFQEITEEVNYLSKEDNLSFEEELHYPLVSEENSKIKVSIWIEENHPSEDGHYISSIMLLDEYWDLVEEKFLNPKDEWNAIFDDYDLDEFEIRIRCNLHGVFSIGKIKRV
jgi:desulfoferrodoxin (superoxide reductase-like protein)